MSNTVNNNIPFVPENTIDPAAGLNEALNVIDMLLQLAVVTVNTNTPPASPTEGDRHVVGQAPTGAWAGRAGLVARYLDGYWNFLPARLAFNLADGVLYGRRTTTWASVAGSGGAAWGSITGTLSAQADLANALAGKVNTVAGKQLSTEDFTSAEKTKLSGIATGATANDTDANLKNRANHTGTQAISTITDLQTTLDAKIPLTQRGAASGVATLDAAGKIPVSQLPPLAVNEVFTVASQAAMLGLTAERGDVAIRTDQAGRAYILSADAPGTLANWISLDQALSVALAALNVLTPAADRLPYFDSTSTAALALFTAQARTLLAAATQAEQKAVLGVELVDNTPDAIKPVSTPQAVAIAASLQAYASRQAMAGATLTVPDTAGGTLYNVSSANPTITLGVAANMSLKVVEFRYVGAGTCTFVTQGSDLIVLETAQVASFTLSRGMTVRMVASGNLWFAVSKGCLYDVAPLASPAFIGPVRLGTYTAATRPSASAWTNYTILVTDTVGGPQQQTSNGSAWLPTNAGTWTTLTLVSGFTAGPTAPQYRIIDDVVEFRGKVTIAAALGMNTIRQFATMPTGYRPTWLASDTDPLRLPICNVTSGVGGVYLNALRTGVFSLAANMGLAANDVIDLSNIRYSLA